MSRFRPSTTELPRLVVFDWDGTLLDSIGSIVACTRATLLELDLPVPSEAQMRASVGLGLREAVDGLLPADRRHLYDEVLAAYRRHWWAGHGAAAGLMPGVEGVLTRLERAGCLLAVATGKSRAGLDADLDRTGLAARFAATRTVDEAASKPAPEMLLSLMEELGQVPAATLMVGDTSFDLLMAANAGCRAVGVTGGGQDRAALAACAPAVILDSVAGQPDWLGAA